MAEPVVTENLPSANRPTPDRPCDPLSAWDDPRMKWIAGCLLLFFHMTFHHWRERHVPLSTEGLRLFEWVPAPLLQDLPGWIVLDPFQVRLWLYLQGLVALGGLAGLMRTGTPRWLPALLGWLWINKLYFYLADVRLFANYHHFHLFYTLVVITTRDPLRWFRVALGVSYVLSGLVKLSPSWLQGEYFTSLPDRLPLLPKNDLVVTAACLAVVILEFLGPVAWFTRIRWLRQVTFAGFLVFHLYSGVLVGLWYTTLMLPLVAAAFAGFDAPPFAGYRFTRRDGLPAIQLALALAGGIVPLAIPGDSRLTGEGRYLGLFMFDARHSVRFQAVVRKGARTWVFLVLRRWTEPGETPPPKEIDIRCGLYEEGREPRVFEVHEPVADAGQVLLNPEFFTGARMRVGGDPYLYHHFTRELVRRHQPDHVSIRLDARLDAREETVTLIDLQDFGNPGPAYRWFRHNEWIRLPGPESPAAYRWP